MEDKKQDVNPLEELVKTADSYRAFFANLANEISKVLADIKVPEKEENTWEMKYPYNDMDEYWFIYDNVVDVECWYNTRLDTDRFDTGNVFPTEEEALLEVKRRTLLTRFRAFRDECNGDWNPDWENECERKYYLMLQKGEFLTFCYWIENKFNQFGYFKNEEDAKRAIELFGDEIKELFVDCKV